MLMEGTGKYFLMLFLVFLIVYITVRISLGSLLKKAKEKSWKAYVPFYTTYVLVELLEMPIKTFYLSLIPFVGLYYKYLITKELIKGFRENPNGAIWYIIFPMYHFPKLVFKNSKFILNEYNLTEEFLETQNILFETSKESDLQSNMQDNYNQQLQIQNNIPDTYGQQPQPQPIIQDNYNQQPEIQTSNQDTYGQTETQSIFTNENLQPDKTYTTYVEVKNEKKEEKPIIMPINNGRPKMCPKCGARLAPNATTCFLCGTKLQ